MAMQEAAAMGFLTAGRGKAKMTAWTTTDGPKVKIGTGSKKRGKSRKPKIQAKDRGATVLVRAEAAWTPLVVAARDNSMRF
jgi:hypothetical protein